MLREFKVKNYKSFKDEILIDFTKFKDYKYNSYVIQNDLINTAIIYGKNSSGKTNLGLALFDITTHLIDRETIPLQLSYYLNADSDESHSTFNYKIAIDNNLIQYSYRKAQANKLLYEEFYVNNEKVFSYNFETHKGDFHNLKAIDAQLLNFEFTDEKLNISMVRYIANNANLSRTSIIKKFMDFVSHMLWFRSVESNSYIGYLKGGEAITTNIIKNGMVSSFNKFLNEVGIKSDLQVVKDALGNEIIANKFTNKLLPFWETASSGTHALTLFFYWSQKFMDVSFLFIDEFDAFYHTELSEYILKLISHRKGFQTVFTTHNTALMTNSILRPDCYFILSNNSLKPLTDCTERELREGHNLEKMYRNGEFIDT